MPTEAARSVTQSSSARTRAWPHRSTLLSFTVELYTPDHTTESRAFPTVQTKANEYLPGRQPFPAPGGAAAISPPRSRRLLTGIANTSIFALANVAAEAQMSTDVIDLMFRAFSDRTRLRILHLLQQGELCVGDIVDTLRVPQPRVSRHLSYLRRAGLVVGRKEGLWCFYALAPVQSPFHKNLLDCITCCLCDVPELKADTNRATKLKEGGGGCPKPRGGQSCPSRSSKKSEPSTAPSPRAGCRVSTRE